MKPTAGDIRCTALGHITRMAIWRFRPSWDATLPAERKLDFFRDAMNATRYCRRSAHERLEKAKVPPSACDRPVFRRTEGAGRCRCVLTLTTAIPPNLPSFEPLVDEVFAELKSSFLEMPRGEGFIDYATFERGYQALKNARRVILWTSRPRLWRPPSPRPRSRLSSSGQFWASRRRNGRILPRKLLASRRPGRGAFDRPKYSRMPSAERPLRAIPDLSAHPGDDSQAGVKILPGTEYRGSDPASPPRQGRTRKKASRVEAARGSWPSVSGRSLRAISWATFRFASGFGERTGRRGGRGRCEECSARRGR